MGENTNMDKGHLRGGGAPHTGSGLGASHGAMPDLPPMNATSLRTANTAIPNSRIMPTS